MLSQLWAVAACKWNAGGDWNNTWGGAWKGELASWAGGGHWNGAGGPVQ